MARQLGMATGKAIVTETFGLAEIGLGTRAPSPINENAKPTDQPVNLAAAMFEASYPQHWPDKTKREAGIDYATMLAAGRQAELIKAGTILEPYEYLWMPDNDHIQALGLIEHIGYCRHALGHCQHLARHLLLDHWEQVEVMAASIQEPS